MTIEEGKLPCDRMHCYGVARKHTTDGAELPRELKETASTPHGKLYLWTMRKLGLVDEPDVWYECTICNSVQTIDE